MSDVVFGSRYRATERIGVGGMAEVYKAVDEVLGRTVAVKVMHARYATDPTFVARFRQEAQSAATLSSPNIVNIYDWGAQDDTYYIAMEYVRGTDLKSILEQRGPIPVDKAADYASQVCRALSVAHGYGIVHRDIKPQNLILTPDGVVKVTDFGIARAGNTNMTQTGSVLGTAYYLSPEQAQGRPLGPPSDLYSLGVVLYELTTGKLPFMGDTPVATALKQVNEPPAPPRKINPNVSPAMEAVILKAMAKNPADRYQTADEMRADLARVVAGQPVSATLAGAIGGVAASAVGAGAVMESTTVMGRVPSDVPAGPVTGTRGRTGTAPPRVPVKRAVSPWVWLLGALAVLLLLGGVAWAVGGAGALFGPPPVDVPNLVGKTAPDAARELTTAGLVAGAVTTSTSDSVAIGVVISQNPQPGSPVRRGSKVGFVVSTGPPTAAVPDLGELTEADALRALQDRGFTIGPIGRKASSVVPADKVISQAPKAGTVARKGTIVSFTVSTGKPMSSVPEVVGKSKATAVSKVGNAGFNVDVVNQFSDSVAVGLVIGTNPPGGTLAETGSTVTIAVSKGPQSFPIPGDVVGKTQAAATTQLKGLGLIVTASTSPSSTTPGLVITTDPVPGTIVHVGSTVQIVVGAP